MTDYVFTLPKSIRTTVMIDQGQFTWAKKNFVNITRLLGVSLDNLRDDYENGDSNSKRKRTIQILRESMEFLLSQFSNKKRDVVLQELTELQSKLAKERS